VAELHTIPPRRLPLDGGDLLLILIVALGSVRMVGLVGAPPAVELGLIEEPDPAAVVGRLLFLIGLQSACILGAVYLVAVRWRGVTWRELGLRPAAAGWYKHAVVLAFLAFPLTLGVNLLVQRLLDGPTTNPQFNVVAPVGFSWFALFGMLLAVGIVVPFVEEVLFRGLFYRWLRERQGVPVAAVVSALGFSVLHGIPWLIPAVAVLGLLLAMVYEKSGSVWPAVITHGVYNSVGLLLLYAFLASGLALP
jgi:membrane protease YdiL (CAAX protease family)